MKKLVQLFFISIIVLFTLGEIETSAQKPDYEKYGKIAIAVVTADYPTNAVRDYQYMGRENVSHTDVIDAFRFQVDENGKKVNVTVKITHNIVNNKLLNLKVEVPQTGS
ncbi:MAG: DUF3889 domain-containing protein [Bacillota bacterium]|nr:DUF3889 domain-containing protein [Bacillota bacterium]